MSVDRNNNIKEGIDKNKSILKERLDIQDRIKFLQASLVKVSFGSDNDRSEIYTSLMNSLHLARASLLKNNKLQKEINYGK